MATIATDLYPIKVFHGTEGLSANVYQCIGENGEYFTTSFSRIFRYEGKLHQTTVLREEHLLPLAELARRCHRYISANANSENL